MYIKLVQLARLEILRCGKVNLTGWVRTKFSKAVRALAARLVRLQHIFVRTRRLCLLVFCLLDEYTLLCIY